MLDSLVRNCLRNAIADNPKVVVQPVFEGDVLVVTVWNSEETRILKRFELTPEAQSKLIASQLPGGRSL